MVNDYISHEGKPRRSGRYPYGSGKRPYQHDIYAQRAYKAAQTKKDVDKIYGSLTPKQKALLTGDGMKSYDKEYLSIEQGEYVAKRFIEKYGDEPIAFLDILTELDGGVGISIATNPKYQGEGYGGKLVKKGLSWWEKNQDNYKDLYWGAFTDNVASRSLAEKNGFVMDKLIDRGRQFTVYKYPRKED